MNYTSPNSTSRFSILLSQKTCLKESTIGKVWRNKTLCKELEIKRDDYHLRRVWRYQRGNPNPYIEEERTTQWPEEKVQKDKQRSAIHTYKTKDRVTRTPLKTGSELMCSGRVGSSCSTSGTRRVNLVTNPVISREWGKNREVLATGTYP